MREKKAFAQRTHTRNTDEVRKKYFLVYEGAETEDIYFEGVNENRQKIGINPLIELVPMTRSYSEEGWSNPKKILDRVMKNLYESKTGQISYETLMNWVMDYFYDEGILTTSKVRKRSMWQTLEWFCTQKLGVDKSDVVGDLEKACEEIARYLEEEASMENVIDDVPKIIRDRAITYAEGIDKICFIFDRDKESFVSKPENSQYEYVLNTCKENGFGFYLTNPCFEFWLLLHFDDISDLVPSELLENRKVRTKRRYTEQMLREKMSSNKSNYNKSSYDVGWFIERIDTAIQNEKKYCEGEDELEHAIGSRIGVLIQELRATE